ncbi:MAG TPA: DUF1501 domain-containing protein [Urbifossiella sp.]|nr:DUF1501 domain-containing protein [Urbifossiella sp.]
MPPAPRPDRRYFLRTGAAGVGLSGWLGRLAAAGAAQPGRSRACILLWMNGGPSQLDTFDPKPDHDNGGPVRAIPTTVPGLRISEYLPRLAGRAEHLAVVRGMATREADHGRGSYLVRTGRVPGGPLRYPSVGSFVGKELERPDAALPGSVSIAPFRQLSPEAYGPGFLGPRYAPLVVAENELEPPAAADDVARLLRVRDLDRPPGITDARGTARAAFLGDIDAEFLAEHPGAAGDGHRTAYRRAAALARSAGAEAFDLTAEPAAVRDRYGRTLFGQGCLLARRLVERGVPFVEVTLSSAPGVGNGIGWDTHTDNFETVKKLCAVLDPAWAMLIDDLKARGLLDTTTIVWAGEFGRTPRINPQRGRDHWANSWSAVLAGGGVKGGQALGRTSADGTEVTDRPVSVPDLLATVCTALKLDPAKQNASNVGRPIRLVEPGGTPLAEVLK